jgi:hypothetical protein
MFSSPLLGPAPKGELRIINRHLLPVISKIASGDVFTKSALIALEECTVWRPPECYSEYEIIAPSTLMTGPIFARVANNFIAHFGSPSRRWAQWRDAGVALPLSLTH